MTRKIMTWKETAGVMVIIAHLTYLLSFPLLNEPTTVNPEIQKESREK